MRAPIVLTIALLSQVTLAQTQLSSRLEMCSDASKAISFIREWTKPQLSGKEKAPSFVTSPNSMISIQSAEEVAVIENTDRCDYSVSPTCRKTVVQKVKVVSFSQNSSDVFVICTVVERN